MKVYANLASKQEEAHDHLFLSYSWTVALKNMILGRFVLLQITKLEEECLKMGQMCRKK